MKAFKQLIFLAGSRPSHVCFLSLFLPLWQLHKSYRFPSCHGMTGRHHLPLHAIVDGIFWT